ncbi:hypothetical protein OG906_16445 [Streptomyces sp. NBC_01426]|uniref:hypothetical protein n=1 Tax=Streptomyces sp. NBC_01426 TaxID=2975866 RepID=UPI002E361765|nr:hypothetical protein [Streptomyces sp. NBC_01426]
MGVDTAQGRFGLEFSAVVSRGKAFLGRRTTSAIVENGPYVWKDLSTGVNPGFPRNACGVSLNILDVTAQVKVLTTDGNVFENSCTYVASGVLTCPSGWTPLIRP